MTLIEGIKFHIGREGLQFAFALSGPSKCSYVDICWIRNMAPLLRWWESDGLPEIARNLAKLRKLSIAADLLEERIPEFTPQRVVTFASKKARDIDIHILFKGTCFGVYLLFRKDKLVNWNYFIDIVHGQLVFKTKVRFIKALLRLELIDPLVGHCLKTKR